MINSSFRVCFLFFFFNLEKSAGFFFFIFVSKRIKKSCTWNSIILRKNFLFVITLLYLMRVISWILLVTLYLVPSLFQLMRWKKMLDRSKETNPLGNKLCWRYRTCWVNKQICREKINKNSYFKKLCNFNWFLCLSSFPC